MGKDNGVELDGASINKLGFQLEKESSFLVLWYSGCGLPTFVSDLYFTSDTNWLKQR